VDNKEVQVEGCGLGIGDHERGIVRPKKWRASLTRLAVSQQNNWSKID
jgi:hypothetical protein